MPSTTTTDGLKNMVKGLEADVEEIITLIQGSASSVRLAEGKSGVLFLGRSGSGKSTLINWLRGCDYQIVKDGLEQNAHLVVGTELAKVGRTDASATLYPHAIELPGEDFCYLDMAGFGDNRGGSVKVAIPHVSRLLMSKVKNIKGFVICIPEEDFKDKRLDHFKVLSKDFMAITRNWSVAVEVRFVITKPSTELKKSDVIKLLTEIKKRAAPDSPEALMINQILTRGLNIARIDENQNFLTRMWDYYLPSRGKTRHQIKEKISGMSYPILGSSLDFLSQSGEQKIFSLYLQAREQDFLKLEQALKDFKAELTSSEENKNQQQGKVEQAREELSIASESKGKMHIEKNRKLQEKQKKEAEKGELVTAQATLAKEAVGLGSQHDAAKRALAEKELELVKKEAELIQILADINVEYNQMSPLEAQLLGVTKLNHETLDAFRSIEKTFHEAQAALTRAKHNKEVTSREQVKRLRDSKGWLTALTFQNDDIEDAIRKIETDADSRLTRATKRIEEIEPGYNAAKERLTSVLASIKGIEDQKKAVKAGIDELTTKKSACEEKIEALKKEKSERIRLESKCAAEDQNNLAQRNTNNLLILELQSQMHTIDVECENIDNLVAIYARTEIRLESEIEGYTDEIALAEGEIERTLSELKKVEEQLENSTGERQMIQSFREELSASLTMPTVAPSGESIVPAGSCDPVAMAVTALALITPKLCRTHTSAHLPLFFLGALAYGRPSGSNKNYATEQQAAILFSVYAISQFSKYSLFTKAKSHSDRDETPWTRKAHAPRKTYLFQTAPAPKALMDYANTLKQTRKAAGFAIRMIRR